jgi:DNA-binding response OmpR family regulator
VTTATRILYIEDSHALGALFTHIVTGLGYNVDVATTGKDGLAIYEADPHDIVFLDYKLPDCLTSAPMEQTSRIA